MVKLFKFVTCHAAVAPAEVYCTDQPVTFTGAAPRLNSSMKSFLKVEPPLPPPPYIWLITIPVDKVLALGFCAALLCPGSDRTGLTVRARASKNEEQTMTSTVATTSSTRYEVDIE